MTLLKLLGSELQRARKDEDLRQEDVAKRLGISLKTLSAYETGRVEPPALMLLRVARELGINLNKVSKYVLQRRVQRRAA